MLSWPSLYCPASRDNFPLKGITEFYFRVQRPGHALSPLVSGQVEGGEPDWVRGSQVVTSQSTRLVTDGEISSWSVTKDQIIAPLLAQPFHRANSFWEHKKFCSCPNWIRIKWGRPQDRTLSAGLNSALGIKLFLKGDLQSFGEK